MCSVHETTQNTGLTTELECAVNELKRIYERFIFKKNLERLDENDVLRAVLAADVEQNITRSAATFGNEIAKILQITRRKEAKRDKWSNVFVVFLSKFYQLMKTSLPIVGAIAEVGTLSAQYPDGIERKLYASQRRCGGVDMYSAGK